MSWDADQLLAAMRVGSLQGQVFSVLQDKRWHCRGHAYPGVQTGQFAGGGGIQGLQRSTGRRPGIVIETRRALCPTCHAQTWFDRWRGTTRELGVPQGIQGKLAVRITRVLRCVDVVELRRRRPEELVIDHKFPMIRWGAHLDRNPVDMTDAQIRAKFQLLKKDSSGNHNLLKSRACEHCWKTGQRAQPLGIAFWYAGGPRWPARMRTVGRYSEQGCIGCGWHDFAEWRRALNASVGAASR